jgi:hypothetical protein
LEPEASQDGLVRQLARAEDRVTRLDERTRSCAFKAGFLARVDFSEALAWGWNSGEVVTAQDLLLHDADMDVRTPTQALAASHRVIRARRKAAGAGPEMFTPNGASWLAGLRRRPPLSGAAPLAVDDGFAEAAPDMVGRLAAQLERLRAGDTESVEAALIDGLGLLERTGRDAPKLLQAAAALEGWRIVDPLPRYRFVGPILAAQWLQARGRTPAGLLGLEGGFRAVRRSAREPAETDAAGRLVWGLKVMTAAAENGLEELRRLDLARQVVEAKIGRRRSHSHHRDVLALLLARPLITAAVVAERLNISPQAARRLIGELGSSVVEISGRSRFRAWRL